MNFLYRLRVLTAALGVAAAGAAVTTTLLGDSRSGRPAGPDTPARPDGARVAAELAQTKFTQQPVITYQLRNGETLFAWQVKPVLAPAPARPRDVLVVVDASASQAGKPLQQARQVLQAVAEKAAPDDRFAVWVVSTPKATKALTKDFVAGASDDLKNAAAALTEVEYGAGATDLKDGLGRALDAMPNNRGRQQVVLFLGDGDSTFNPLTEADRVAVGGRMDQSEVQFFAVPLGVKVNPNNLHGLASLTGGAVVRLTGDLNTASKRAEFVHQLTAALDVPVLKSEAAKFGPEVTEAFPTKLPPLRADRPTLVVGKVAKGAPALTATVTGKIGNNKAEVSLAQPVTAPAADNYFLNVMLDQWRAAPHKDAPAILQADRALALASTQVKLYRDEFLTQAVWAVTMDPPQLDEAARMYEAARRIDPNDGEADAGLKLVDKLKVGAVTRADLHKRIAAAQGLKIGSKEEATRIALQAAAQDEPKKEPAPAAAPAGAPPAPGTSEADAIRNAQTRQRIEEERYRVIVDAAVRRARDLLRTNPDQAYDDLYRMRENVAAYTDLGARARDEMLANLTAQMRDIFTRGAEIKRQAAAERQQIAAARQRLNEFDRQQLLEDQTKARIEAFRQLMQTARYELAYQEAQLMIQERISRGLTVPPQAVASYIIGQQATQLREWRELVRIRDDRYLLAMMQTEKSHVPMPDEPPVHFPPAAVWRELTGQRRDRYTNVALGAENSANQQKLRSLLENQRVVLGDKFQDITTVPLIEILQTLSKLYDVTFVIADGGDASIREKKPTLSTTKLDGLTLGAYMDVILESMQLTYIVRPDYIEVCTYDRRLEEKVTRAFPVADLVVPIPQAVQIQSLQQSLGIQTANLNNFGQATIFGGGLVQLGAPNIVGGALAAQGVPGGLAGGAPGGVPGGLIQGFAQNNQGVGGGVTGVGGGQLGQFGNLGGQFGFQGGTQADILIPLIQQTVARGEWANAAPPPGAGMGAPGEPEPVALPVAQLNSLSFHPPSLSLIVRGTSRYHGFGGRKLKKPEGMAALPNPNPRALVIGPNTNVGGGGVKPPADVVAQTPKAPAPAVAKPTLTDPKTNAEKVLARVNRNDPKQMWQQAIEMGVDNTGLVVACVDFLMDNDEPGHAAEMLKATLRKGLTTSSWAHDALAVALQSSGAGAAETERAAVSALDLDPTDPKALLKAAKAESDQKNFPQALAFCKRAADLAPDAPGAYANALAYAERAGDVKADVVEWAAGNLLRRDWAADGIDYHKEAKDRAAKIAATMEAAGAKDAAAPIRRLVAENTQRDLEVQVNWSGVADLSLTVTEPGGSVCDAGHKRTVGGGVLKTAFDRVTDRDAADQPDARGQVYTAARAFSGTYTLNLKTVFGRTADGKAQVVVTKFKGTPQQRQDIFTVDLADPKPVAVALDGGSRTDLATVIEEVDEARLATTYAPLNGGRTGMAGGVGRSGTGATSAVNTSVTPNLPVVLPGASENTLPRVTDGAADIRTAMKVNPDRRTMTVTVKPVFGGANKPVPMPTVSLLPGGEK